MWFAMESQEFKKLSLGNVLRKKKWYDFQKMENTIFVGPFCSNLGNNLHKNQADFRISSPLTSCKKLKQANEQILRKTLAS